MGWLGWSPEQTFNAAIPDILTAYRGRVEMLNAIFGGGENEQKPRATRPLSPQLFDAVFAKK